MQKCHEIKAQIVVKIIMRLIYIFTISVNIIRKKITYKHRSVNSELFKKSKSVL